jgi:hypothetical protein
MNQKLLASRINGQPIEFGSLACGYTPVDLDTFAMGNSSSKKELVGRTVACFAKIQGASSPVRVMSSSTRNGIEPRVTIEFLVEKKPN